jgi:hypothetical protein
MTWFILSILILALSAKASQNHPQWTMDDALNPEEVTFGDLLRSSASQPVFFETSSACGTGFCTKYNMVEDVTVHPFIDLSLGKDYLPSKGQLYPYLVHQALLTFTVIQEGIQYPLSGFPVDLKTVAGTQKVYSFDKKRGKIIGATIHPERSTRLFTNDKGQLRLSVKIKDDGSVAAQNLLFRTIDNPETWNMILLDLSTVQRLSELDAATVKEAHPQISDEQADMVTEKVTKLFGFVKHRQSMLLSQSPSAQLYDAALLKNRPMSRASSSWEAVTAEFTNGLDRFNLHRSFNPIKWVKGGVTVALKLVSELFRLVGTTLMSVLNKLKVMLVSMFMGSLWSIGQQSFVLKKDFMKYLIQWHLIVVPFC